MLSVIGVRVEAKHKEDAISINGRTSICYSEKMFVLPFIVGQHKLA
jgi:hypothetical protein